MGSIGPGELLIIGLIALLIFGAGRIADIGKGLGQGIKNFKAGLKEGDVDKSDDALAAKADAKPVAKADATDSNAKKKRVVVDSTDDDESDEDAVAAAKKKS